MLKLSLGGAGLEAGGQHLNLLKSLTYRQRYQGPPGTANGRKKKVRAQSCQGPKNVFMTLSIPGDHRQPVQGGSRRPRVRLDVFGSEVSDPAAILGRRLERNLKALTTLFGKVPAGGPLLWCRPKCSSEPARPNAGLITGRAWAFLCMILQVAVHGTVPAGSGTTHWRFSLSASLIG